MWDVIGDILRPCGCGLCGTGVWYHLAMTTSADQRHATWATQSRGGSRRLCPASSTRRRVGRSQAGAIVVGPAGEFAVKIAFELISPALSGWVADLGKHGVGPVGFEPTTTYGLRGPSSGAVNLEFPWFATGFTLNVLCRWGVVLKSSADYLRTAAMARQSAVPTAWESTRFREFIVADRVVVRGADTGWVCE